MTKAAKEHWPDVEKGIRVTRWITMGGKPDQWKVGAVKVRKSVALQLIRQPGMVMTSSTAMSQTFHYQKPDPA